MYVDTARRANRFCQALGLRLPVALAPMAYTSGGALAAACAQAGALGLVGGGYADLPWLQREYPLALTAADTGRIGCGFVTWALDQDASALDWLLDHAPAHLPRALMLSFGDPRPYGARLARAGIPLICQIQRLDQAPLALEAGATTLVAQGIEAGGHGMNALNGRSTLVFVPELADWLAAHAPGTVLLAAGGIADHCGVQAALQLGADGVLMGTRFLASEEALTPPGAKAAVLAATGDDTARSSIFDVVRDLPWPTPYDYRSLRNALHREWEGRESELHGQLASVRAIYATGLALQNYSLVQVSAGESVGLVRGIARAADILQGLLPEAA